MEIESLMGITKQEDIIGWQIRSGSDESKIICAGCGDPGEDAIPLTKDDFDDTDIVTCDKCGERIQ
jgi:hypothetical protein